MFKTAPGVKSALINVILIWFDTALFCMKQIVFCEII